MAGGGERQISNGYHDFAAFVRALRGLSAGDGRGRLLHRAIALSDAGRLWRRVVALIILVMVGADCMLSETCQLRLQFGDALL